MKNPLLIALLLACVCPFTLFAQTSWRGTVSTAWENASNWTAGIPTATTEAIIGDASFTGSSQPAINGNASCRSLTLGGAVAATLTVNKNLTISGNLLIQANGTLLENKTTITVSGNWTNNGTFSASNNNSTVIFNGMAQTLGGTTVTTFRKININSGSTITLGSNITVSGTGAQLTVSGTINPGQSPTYRVTAASGATTINGSGTLKVNAAVFTDNYSLGTFATQAGYTIDYSSTTVNQTVASSLVYHNLRISGSGIKTLGGNSSTSAVTADVGNVTVASGTLDLSTFTLDRQTTTTGGSFSVANGASLWIGGTANFPNNYGNVSLSLNSNAVYYANNQTVSARTYGNLSLTGVSGAVVKTMPATPFTVSGNFNTSAGTATSVTFTAASAITFNGNVTIGASTVFDGGSFTHTAAGNITNSGTFTGNTSTLTVTGANTIIGGAGTYNFHHLSVAGSGVTVSAASISIAGDLTTTGSGTFRHATDGTTSFTGTSRIISGTGIQLFHAVVSGSSTASDAVVVNGNLTVSGSLTGAGTIIMAGTSRSILGAGTKTFASLQITGSISTAVNFTVNTLLDVSGSLQATAGTATFAGTSVLTGTANLFDVTVNGTSLQLATNAILGIAGSLTLAAGSINTTANVPNTVTYNGSAGQSVVSATYHHLQLSGGDTKAAAGALSVNGNLTIGGSTTFNAATFTHTVRGNWTSSGSFTPAASTIHFTGTNDAFLSGTTDFNNVSVTKTGGKALWLQTAVSAVNVQVSSGFVRTGAHTLTITNDRTGNGIILGTIQRTHSFTTGVAYAFSSPYNTISFSSVTGVTTVTVTVMPGTVAGFPYGSAVNRLYDISVPSGTYTASLRLFYETEELNGNDETTMQMWRYNGQAWSASGITSYDADDNFIELAGITDLTSKWAISDYAYVVRWNGSQSTNWNDPQNWTVVEGSPGTPPSPTDVVEIGTAPFTNQPGITSSVTVKSIVFGSSQAATLSIGSNGALTTKGNITGRWQAAASHAINVGAQNLTVQGNFDMSDGTAGHHINLSVSSGTVAIQGSLEQSGEASITFTGSGVLQVGGDYVHTGGNFVAAGGTVVYNGAAPQYIASLPYHNLTIDKNNADAEIIAPVTVGGHLLVQSGSLSFSNNTTIAGNVSIAPGASAHGNSTAVNVGGSWTNDGIFYPDNSTVTFDGTAAQNISGSAFNNVAINKPSGSALLGGNVILDGNLTIAAGTLDLQQYTANRQSMGGVLTLANGASLLVGGATNFPGNFSTTALGETSTVQYNGTAAQTVKGVVYGHLLFSNGGSQAKTFGASATINGDLTIGAGATVSGGAFTINLKGSWINNGSFVPATGTVVFNGTNKQVAGSTTFRNLIVNGTYAYTADTFQYESLLHITSTGDIEAGTCTTVIAGELIIDGRLNTGGITSLSGTVAQNIRLTGIFTSTASGIIRFNGNVAPSFNSTSTPLFANLVINNTGGLSPSVGWSCVVSFTVTDGASFHGGPFTHNMLGHFTNNGVVTSSGTLNFAPTNFPVNIKLSGNQFSSTGTVRFGGTAAITLSGAPTALNNVVIANTHSNGIAPVSGWNIGHNLSVSSNALFKAGNFSYAVGGDIESDGRFEGDASTIVMTSPSGIITAGPDAVFNNLTIGTGATVQSLSGFKVAGHFINNGTYDGSDGTLIMVGSNAANISGTAATYSIANLAIDKSAGAVVTLQNNLENTQVVQVKNGVFNLGAFSLTEEAGNPGWLTVESGGTLRIGGTRTLPTFGSYAFDNLSTVEYAGSTQTVANATTYGNLHILSAGTKTAAGALTIRNNFGLSDATFTGGAFTHNVGGHWNMTSGTFSNSGTTIALNGTADQEITSSGAFQNLVVNKTSGLVQLLSHVQLNGLLTFTAGSVNLGGFNFVLGNSGGITGASTSRYFITGSTGSLVQPIGAAAAKSFPVGTATQYLPATVAFSAGSTGDNVRVRVQGIVYSDGSTGTPLTSGAVNASWIMAEDVSGGSDATVTLQWPGTTELSGFLRSGCRLARHSGTAWDYGSSSLSATGTDPYAVSRSGIDAFSLFAVTSFAVLPVQWLHVSGRHADGSNIIQWSTAQETANQYFVVEYAHDGSRFQEAGRVNAVGYSTTATHYQFVHHLPPAGRLYYRIRQVDRDGKFSYSKTIVVAYAESGLQVGPVNTLFTGNIYLTLLAPSGSGVKLVLTDGIGRMLHTENRKLERGTNTIKIDGSGFASGIYYLLIDDGKNRPQTLKLKKQ